MTVKNNLLLHLIVEDGKNTTNDYVAKIMPCQLKTTQALVYKVYFKLTFRTGTYGGRKNKEERRITIGSQCAAQCFLVHSLQIVPLTSRMESF